VSPKKNTHRKDAKGAKQVIVFFTVNLELPAACGGHNADGISIGEKWNCSPLDNVGKPTPLIIYGYI
jgi:hypothetical protein